MQTTRRTGTASSQSVESRYCPAMDCQTPKEARAILKSLVDSKLKWMPGISRRTAIRSERMNLGYYAGYCDDETRARVERLFKCEHPIFGSIEKNGPPTAKEAFEKGMYLGIREIGKKQLRIDGVM